MLERKHKVRRKGYAADGTVFTTNPLRRCNNASNLILSLAVETAAKQAKPLRVHNLLVHAGRLSLYSSGFNRQKLLKHPLRKSLTSKKIAPLMGGAFGILLHRTIINLRHIP